MDLAPDFDEFIASLTAHGVEFVIVGAYALAFHGAPRFTGDLLSDSRIEAPTPTTRLPAAAESRCGRAVAREASARLLSCGRPR